MQAYVLPEFGDPDVFESRELPVPHPGPNEVLVEVHATSVNPLDSRIRREGQSLVELPAVLGYDVSGVVKDIGPGVDDFGVGDAVFYTPTLFEQGTYAEYNVARSELVAHKPPDLSHAEAASLPVVGCTAWEAVVDRLAIELGDTILIHGGGGVGTQAVQLAAAAGARVVCVTGKATLDLVRKLGADRAIDYTSQDFVDVLEGDPNGVDAVLTTVGGDTIQRSLEVLNDYGRIVDIVGEVGEVGQSAKLKNAAVDFMALTRSRRRLEAVARLIGRDQLRPVVDSVLPLSQVAEAHRRLDGGGLQGKIVLQIQDA